LYRKIRKETGMKQEAIAKLNGIIEEGRNNMVGTIVDIAKEFKVRRDYIVKPDSLDYAVSSQGVELILDGNEYNLTSHALNQLYARAGIPKVFADRVSKLQEYELLRTILLRLNQRANEKGVLLRTVENTVKGLLSPSYLRLDASPLFEGFIERSLEAGFVPYRGMNTDFRYQLSFLLPEVFEIASDEFVVFGISLTTGDYGSQALQISVIALRIWCSNLAVGMDIFRKVHIGKRFELLENVIELSAATIELDTKTLISGIGDVVNNSLAYIREVKDVITRSTDREIDLKKALSDFRKRGMSQEIAAKVELLYETEQPLEILPQKSNAWRLSNCISFLAKSETGDKRIDLETMAFDVLGQAA
jgi:hypothetical protein